MKFPVFFGSNVVEIYRQTFQVLKENPTLLLLFFGVSFFDFLALFILFLAPSEPFSYILAPIVRTFWSESFLHYPANFILLPKLFNHAHFIVICIFGIVVTGITVKKIEAYTEGRKLSVLPAAGCVFEKYLVLLLAWILSYAAFNAAIRILPSLLPKTFSAQLAAAFFTGLVLQSLFAFLMPALLIANRGFFRDIGEGLWTGARCFLSTSFLMAIPIILIVLLSLAKALAPYLVTVYPEAVLWILCAGVILSMVVDLFVTSATTLLYLKVRNSS